MSPHFSKYLKPKVRTNKLVSRAVLFTTLVLQDYTQGYILHISLNSLGFYLPRMLLEFYLTCIFQYVGENFSMMFSFLENALNLCIFTHAPVPHSKLQLEFFENLFLLRRKGWRKLHNIQIQSENMRMTWNISLFLFGMIAIFLNAMALQFCK